MLLQEKQKNKTKQNGKMQKNYENSVSKNEKYEKMDF